MPPRPGLPYPNARVGDPRAQLDVVERAVSELAGDREVTMRATIGEPVHTLTKIAEEYPSAILVVGSRGRTASRAALFGSTSATLAARARTPVLIVPPTARRPETLARGPSAAVGAA